MKFGISPDHYKILDILVLTPIKEQGAEVFLFGSRAVGKHHPNSDVDLLYKAQQEFPKGFISSIKEAIEESNFPYTVELVNDSELAESYRNSVVAQMKRL